MQHQFEFDFRDEESLARELERLTGQPVDVTVTDNTSTMMSVMRDRHSGTVRIRLHRMFLSAGTGVLRALGDWVKRPRCRQSGEVIDEFIRQHRHLIRTKTRTPRDSLCTEGVHHDLLEYFERLNREYFRGSVKARITWGRMAPGRRRRSIRFGSYTAEDDVIRVHPLLDQDFVPAYFVRYIVFHEMLHAYLGVRRGPSGRRQIHSAEFRRLEQAYPDFEKAVAWQNTRANLKKLLR